MKSSVAILLALLSLNKARGSAEIKFERCSGQGDWIVEIAKLFNQNGHALTNYKLAARPIPGGDEYYVVYSDSEHVSYSTDGTTRHYSGLRFNLVIDGQRNSESEQAVLYRWNQNTSRWHKYTYWCDAHQ